MRKKLEEKPKLWAILGESLFCAICVMESNDGISLLLSLAVQGTFIIAIICIGFIITKYRMAYTGLKNISQSSMCAYLFHRQVLEGISSILGHYTIRFSPILAYGFVLPGILVFSFYVQKIYNNYIKRYLCKILRI